MSDSYKNAFENTVLAIYPVYMKKAILKQFVDEGIIINNRKNSAQIALNFTDSLDVSEYENTDDKLKCILDQKNIISYFEEFEYRKQYRHFCYFECGEVSTEKIEELVKSGDVNVYDKREKRDDYPFDKPTIYIAENLIYLKFSQLLNNEQNSSIKYTILCVIDKDSRIVEMRFDRVGIAYKNSYDFYKIRINEILNYLIEKLDLEIIHIDFKSVIEYMKSEKDDITIYAQRMHRNGTTAYLEAFDDGDSVMPILGELTNFMDENSDIFNIDNNTRLIRDKLLAFVKEIEIKSDMPMVKVKMDAKDIKFGITHNYKETEDSLFMFYGDLLVDKERMNYVREYLIGCYKEFKSAISADSLPTE